MDRLRNCDDFNFVFALDDLLGNTNHWRSKAHTSYPASAKVMARDIFPLMIKVSDESAKPCIKSIGRPFPGIWNINYVGFVLCYFVYGIFIVIAFNLGALLLLLHMHWIIAVTEIIMSLFYVRMLVIIYDVYDLMQRGKVINTNEQSLLDEEPI
ncbi:uncharacterized protein LOC128200279 isoform X2 [Galleria mellonella]|uniref:Uncharacterized protein LOC128200279 isoform X2 n=1 Tax=Galleria mellonella TaxID=7137 RepID=A0ABM3MCL7_GALME|nr:uncharacterized protein LOC128200279 isoform X2 [Galleria mellonella]